MFFGFLNMIYLWPTVDLFVLKNTALPLDKNLPFFDDVAMTLL